MKNKIFFHSSESTKKIIIRFLLGLIPLILYGIYKNGILLYKRDFIDIIAIPKVIYLLLISLGMYLLINFLFKRKNIWSLDLLYVAIIPLFMPPNINMFIYAIGLFLSLLLANLLSTKFTFNKMAFCKLLIILLVVIFGNYTYLNSAEKLHIYSFNYWNLLWGRNVGGIATTNIVLGVAILLIFSIFNNYKKICAYVSLLTFIIISFIFSNFSIDVFLNSSAILGLILLNTDSLSTPHNKLAMIIYGLILGILAFIFTYFINSNEGVFIAALILSFFSPVLDKIVEK